MTIVGLASGQLQPASSSNVTAIVDWQKGWCQGAVELGTAQSALSLGVSVLIGVAVWVVLVVAGLAVFSAVRSRRRLREYIVADQAPVTGDGPE